MATRGIIARKTDYGFRGVYHHWDSYLSGLGATLFNLYNDHFKKDIMQMLQALIDEHPAGWSSINDADFSLDPGFGGDAEDKRRPHCYCHGDRHEKGLSIASLGEARQYGAEYVYVIDTDASLTVYERHGEFWEELLTTNLDTSDWWVQPEEED